ncbi:peptidoglycan-binding protein [Pelomonas sp. HMWF004]|nr:peptidoglycan-binding protein [Pelomonas sp. HMWF004]
MAASISASVGRDGHNQPADVKVVQALLNQRGFDCGQVDGRCGRRTVQAIISFQSDFTRTPDGRVDPGGKTLARLNNEGATMPPKPELNASLTRLVPAPLKSAINGGLKAVSNDFMTQALGAPRDSYAVDCQPLTNVRLKRNITSASVGPFRVTGLAPAVKSLNEVMSEIQRMRPEVYKALGTAGMLCCRYVRGSTSSISNHSWGTAVDLTLNGVLDRRGDGKVQYGLTLIAPIFNRFGWYWGATFKTEDAMHFEAGQELVTQWAGQLS